MKLILKNAVLVFGICCFATAHAQDPVLDSLKHVLKNTSTADTQRMSILDEMVEIAPEGEWELYSEEMGKLAKQFMTSQDPAIQKAGKRYYSVSINNDAFILLEKGDYTTALNKFEQCLKVNRELDDKENMALTLSNIGVILDRQGDIANAISNYKMALTLQKESESPKEMVATLNNIGVIYSKTGQTDSALLTYMQGLKIAEQIKFKSTVFATLLAGLGGCLESNGEYDQAMEYYNRGLKMSEELNDPIGKSKNLTGIANVLFKRNDLDKALDFSRRAVAASTEGNNPKTLITAAAVLKSIYEKKGNYKEAFKIYQLEIATRDTLERKENQKAVIRHQFKYEYDIKDATAKAEQQQKDVIAQKELQKQKLVRNGFVGGFAIVLLFAGVFFTQRNKIKKGKKLSDELLLNILPEEVAEELKAKGEADARLIDEVTVLFTDFKGFTEMSEQLTPKQLVKDIHECFSAFDHIMEKYGMEKIKTIGDSYMAAGGLPTPNKTHAEDAVNAALEIRQFIAEGKARKIAANAPYFEIRIGIHTGPVVAGIVGVKKFAYDIWGDTVNTASRMESSGEIGQVNISETTCALVKDKFICTHRGKISAKGKGDIDMYFVEA